MIGWASGSMFKLEKRSPLGMRDDDTAAPLSCCRGLSIQERPFTTKVRVQRLAAIPLQAKVSLADWDLPANATIGSDPIVFWTSPIERLIVSSHNSPQEVITALKGESHAAAVVCTDVSHSLTTLRVTGPGAADVLCCDIKLDLHNAAFSSGQCAQTLFAQVPVILHRTPAVVDAWDLYVERPVVQYVRDWLVRCGGGEAP
jgi:heterotetrameric sarcosine oxidase gamma subunit